MENECEALPGVAYPRVRDNRSTVNTKTGYDDDLCKFYATFQAVFSMVQLSVTPVYYPEYSVSWLVGPLKLKVTIQLTLSLRLPKMHCD